ncbi:MAG: hypothetical protein HZB53_08885 [Chloroflexi bacterium]|nr:hypothetical protein [Chloroflexota bacterium]
MSNQVPAASSTISDDVSLDLLVHATHEAGYKVGGIGAVLDGLLRQPAYNRAVRRTILVGPFDPWNGRAMERLYAPGNGFRARYSSNDGLYDVPPEVARALEQVEIGYRVRILYGTRAFGEAEHEVLLVESRSAAAQATNDFKFHLWERYGIDSYRYQAYPEYESYIQAAEPSFAAVRALADSQPGRAAIMAHEWLGLPVAFCAKRHQPDVWRTVFYAHEAATARALVENHNGHDTRFYNAMFAARDRGLSLEQVFGDWRGFFKHALLLAASRCDSILAVGDLVVDELRFLSPAFAHRPIALVYNGVPSPNVTLDARRASKQKLQQYVQNLLGIRPSWIFSHVTRLVSSKALWRDLRVMEHLDRQLVERGESAVLFALTSSLPAGRHSDDVHRWEREYGWPVNHRSDNGDLADLEFAYFDAVQQFNRIAHTTRIVFINQFGFSRERCGARMPADIGFADLRNGTDLEFGQSIYEPFGIGQVEPLASGALCCLSNTCGCVGFISRAGGIELPNIVLADYVSLPARYQGLGLGQLLGIGQWERDFVEGNEARRVAGVIAERLPRDDAAARQLLEDGAALAQRMSWSVVVEQYLLPELQRLF